MRLQEIELRNFRNYEHLNLKFDPALNVFLGENAQGKTNLLEAIYVLALVRSHRTNSNQELIRWGSDFAKLQTVVQKNTGRMTLDLVLSTAGKKAALNHLEKKRLSQYVGQLNVVLFAPEDLKLVKGAPSVRRRFLDMELGQINANYLTNNSKYRQVLKQRNNYLKQLRSKKVHDLVYLDVISDQLAGFGAELIAARFAFLRQLQTYLTNIHNQLTQKQEQLQLEYQAAGIDPTQNVEKLYQELLNQLKKVQARDLALGSTSIGPHHDDFRFMVNGNDLQKFGSQGQQRSAVLSLKLAEIELFHEQVGDYPILLLDDVLSELDQNRQTQLLKAIQNRIQTFITTTSLDGVKLAEMPQPKIFQIKAGGIV
ncbi:DNA replication/repair protein RecF [Bombilactobacillus folatiphilus]|uniref:DNA replication and repair protein RecF n=1 Tax=Bombilactobacillus folatiphilus TaxID=2923362 RepID=A0ABY4P8Y8_9LACO|nr:DNA replication/repair protein RecF [Bombilactobacillus folatiphilus]UQS82127.1 DNA replication/repair protein RecF [Bombilactobacillus folatiphilus]